MHTPCVYLYYIVINERLHFICATHTIFTAFSMLAGSAATHRIIDCLLKLVKGSYVCSPTSGSCFYIVFHILFAIAAAAPPPETGARARTFFFLALNASSPRHVYYKTRNFYVHLIYKYKDILFDVYHDFIRM